MEVNGARLLDLYAMSAQAASDGDIGPVWSLSSPDLNVNLLRFSAGDGVAPHVNAEVDVIGLVVAGEGVLALNGHEEPLRAGMLFFVPKGAERAIRATSAELVYLTCHRRRTGLMPTRARTRTER